MHGPLKLVVISTILIALFAAIILVAGEREEDGLLLYCAVVMKAPMERLIAQFEAQEAIPVAVQYGGSGTLLSTLRIVKQGDLYLAADESYIALATEHGLIASSAPIALLQPVIAVPHGNPKGIEGLEDLQRKDISLALGNPEAASIGKQTQVLLESLGYWNTVEGAVNDRGVFKPTVNEVANDIKLGAVDAGIVWDATARLYPDLEAVSIGGAEAFQKQVTVAILGFSERKDTAQKFLSFLQTGAAQELIAESGLNPLAPSPARRE